MLNAALTRVAAVAMQMGESQDQGHPHAPSGTPAGGQFTKNNSGSHPPPKPVAKKVTSKPMPRPVLKPHPTAPTPITRALSTRVKNDPGQVRTLQHLLASLGLGDVSEDGTFGPKTEAAVKAAQVKLGLKPNGHASTSLAHQMAAAVALSPCGVKASAGSGVFIPLSTDMIRASAAPMTGVELARPGTWQLSTGHRTFTAENLRDAADFFAASGQTRIPLGFGHTDSRFDGDPAFGWVSNIRYTEDAKGPVLLGDLVDMDDWLAAAAPKRWPNRSIEGFANLDWNGRTYSLALTRLALLGSTPPAMPTLRSLADLREAVAAAAADSGAEFVSAAAPSEEDTTSSAAEAVVPTSPKETGMDPAKFREALGLADDVSDDEVMAALAEAGFTPATEIPQETPVAASGVNPELLAASGMIRVDASAWNEREERLNRLEAQAQRTRDGERDQIITEAIQQGKFAPARRDHWVKLWTADPEGARSMIASLARNVMPIAAAGYSGGVGEDDHGPDEYAALWDTNARKVG